MALRLSLSLLAFILCLLLGAPANAQDNAGLGMPSAESAPPLIPHSAFPPPHSPDWDPACYRTYDEMQAALQGIASTYPGLATLTDAGPSWEGTRRLWLIRLTNLSRPGPKPSIFLLAGQHPRDIAGPDMLMRYAAYLTQGYGVDPDVTLLLDNRQVYILPLANPDGYYQVYACYVVGNSEKPG